jgi:hypothetical protein
MTSIAHTKALAAMSARSLRIAAARFASAAATGEASAAEGRTAAAGTAPRRPNWLEENCGDVPTHPRKQDDEISEMLRGGHAIQVAHNEFLRAKVWIWLHKLLYTMRH